MVLLKYNNLRLMNYKEKHTEKYIKIGFFILLFVLNFILLTKVTSNSNVQPIFEKHIRN